MPDSFEQSYWSEDSQYGKFDDYRTALDALRDWYQGLLRLVDRDLPPPGRHVDAGCGHGAIVHELLERGWDAHGFDASSWIIEQAHQSDSATAHRFIAAGLPDIPFDGRFDLITCLEVLEHIDEPVAALRSLRDRLEPQGTLIATTPNLRPRMPWWDPVSADPTHVSVHDPDWWKRACSAAGLHVRRLTTFIAVPALWRLHPICARWIPLGRRTGPGILIVAQPR